MFEKEREVITMTFETKLQNAKQSFENEKDFFAKELEVKDCIIASLNQTIDKLKQEIKVIKQILKSPHLYSKFNYYVSKKIDFEYLKNGIERNRSAEANKGTYSMFDNLDINDFTNSSTSLNAKDKPKNPEKGQNINIMTNKAIQRYTDERKYTSDTTDTDLRYNSRAFQFDQSITKTDSTSHFRSFLHSNNVKYREQKILNLMKVRSLSKGRKTDERFFTRSINKRVKRKKLKLPDSRISTMNPMNTNRQINTPYAAASIPLNITDDI